MVVRSGSGRGVFSRAFWTRRRLIIAGVVLLAVLAMVFWPRRTVIPNYATQPAARGELTVTVSATGTLQPQNQVDVGAEVSGRVDQVLVDFNDHVKVGQVIAVINTDQIEAQLEQTRATLATNRATVAQTLSKRDRYRSLQQANAASILDLQAAEADYLRAVASVKSAEAQIANNQASLTKAQVRAPIDGVVLDRKIAMGQTVASGFQTPVLFTLASSLDTMQLAVDIDEADIGMVRQGQTATFVVDAFPQHRFNAKLVSLHNSPQTSNNVVTYRGVLEVDNREGLLRPGLTATADILISRVNNALLVPNGALRFTPPNLAPDKIPPAPKVANGQRAGRVWVQVAPKTPAQPRDLVVGGTDGRHTQVLSGNLKAGEAVITDIALPGRPASP